MSTVLLSHLSKNIANDLQKNLEFAKSSNTSLLKTSSDPSTCGVLLKLQKKPEENTYLLSGNAQSFYCALNVYCEYDRINRRLNGMWDIKGVLNP